MNILFDLLHPADVNLFKNTINLLSQKGYNVLISYRDRGKLAAIAGAELPNYKLNKIGEHKKKIIGKITSLLTREISAYFFLKNNKVDILVSQGLACGIACKLSGVKVLHYDDDNEYLITYLVGKWFSDIDLMPDFTTGIGKNIVKHVGYKELAYLHPKYFQPSSLSLQKHDLIASNYVFIREISNISINYKNKNDILPKIIEHLINKNLKVVLSLEDKSKSHLYSQTCIILEEPIVDLYSIIYFSKFVISSGDTMARESCLMGIPCIYTGGREMKANQRLIEIGLMVKSTSINQILETINKINDSDTMLTKRNQIMDLILNKFDDTNDVIFQQISLLSKNDYKRISK
jgi:predicted glycosyltransferase